jgi:hypothetical protein
MPAEPAPPAGRRHRVGSIFVDAGPLRRAPEFPAAVGRADGVPSWQPAHGGRRRLPDLPADRLHGHGRPASLGQLAPLLAGSLLGGPVGDAWDRRRVLLCTHCAKCTHCANDPHCLTSS